MISRDHHSLSLVAKYSYLVAQQCHAKISSAKTKQKQKKQKTQGCKDLNRQKRTETWKTEKWNQTQ